MLSKAVKARRRVNREYRAVPKWRMKLQSFIMAQLPSEQALLSAKHLADDAEKKRVKTEYDLRMAELDKLMTYITTPARWRELEKSLAFHQRHTARQVRLTLAEMARIRPKSIGEQLLALVTNHQIATGNQWLEGFGSASRKILPQSSIGCLDHMAFDPLVENTARGESKSNKM